MKKIAALTFALFAAASPLCADEFAEMIHVLAVKAASLGTYYDADRGSDGWGSNYYFVETWNERFAAEYGSIAGYNTFTGVCADYTLYAYNDIKANTRKYNAAGMNADQFFIASADTSSQIEIQKTTTREGAKVFENGVYMTYYYNSVPVKKYGVKNVWTHKEWDEKRASNHAWIWIQRDDGVWFWVDPTWTDNLGWVVWGYISNGEEVLLKPDAKFCVKWDERYLDNRADPPARGPKIQPTYVASSRQTSSSQDSSYTPSYSRSSYSSSYGYSKVISVGVSKPLGDFMYGNYIGTSFWDTVGGVSISYEDGNARSIIGVLQLDYYNLNQKTLLFDFGLGKQLGKVFALYGGAGIGASTTADSFRDFGLDNIRLAWKAFAGLRLTFWRISLRADVSYVRDSGVILGAYAGWMF